MPPHSNERLARIRTGPASRPRAILLGIAKGRKRVPNCDTHSRASPSFIAAAVSQLATVSARFANGRRKILRSEKIWRDFGRMQKPEPLHKRIATASTAVTAHNGTARLRIGSSAAAARRQRGGSVATTSFYIGG